MSIADVFLWFTDRPSFRLIQKIKWDCEIMDIAGKLKYNKIHMKIIKKGKAEKKEWRGLCLDCHCEFIYDKNDIKIDQCEGDYVVCPTCKRFINVMGRNNA